MAERHGVWRRRLLNRSSRPLSKLRAYLAAYDKLIAIAHVDGLLIFTLDLPAIRFPRSLKSYLNSRSAHPPELAWRYERNRPGDLIHLDIKNWAVVVQRTPYHGPSLKKTVPPSLI